MIIHSKHIYKWLLNYKPKPVGLEVIYNNNHEVVGVSFYPNNIVLEHPVNPIAINENLERYILDRYYMPNNKKQQKDTIEKIIDEHYYRHNGVWYYDDAPFTGPFLKGDIEVLNIFYNDRDILKRYFELNM